MNVDLELEEWKSLWQAEVEIPADLRNKANRQLRRMRIMLIGDIAVTIVMGGAVIAWAIASKEPPVRLLATWVWLTLIAAWFFRWFNDRGNWSGAAPNTEVFLQLLKRRYRATLRNVKFGYALGAVQLLFSSAWVYFELNRSGPITVWQFLTLKASLAAWLCIALLLAGALWFSHKLEQELASVEKLQREWQGSEVPLATMDDPEKRRGSRLIVPLLEAITMIQSRLEGVVWQQRKKKKGWRI